MEIVNSTITASCSISPLPIQLLSQCKQPTKFDARCLKTSNGTFLIFRSGKIVCVGSKNVSKPAKVIKNVEKMLQRLLNLPLLSIKDVKLQNVVAHFNLPGFVDLTELYKLWQSKFDLIYEPEIYPAIKLIINNSTLLIYRSGKVIITGCKSITELKFIKEVFDHQIPVNMAIVKKQCNRKRRSLLEIEKEAAVAQQLQDIMEIHKQPLPSTTEIQEGDIPYSMIDQDMSMFELNTPEVPQEAKPIDAPELEWQYGLTGDDLSAAMFGLPKQSEGVDVPGKWPLEQWIEFVQDVEQKKQQEIDETKKWTTDNWIEHIRKNEAAKQINVVATSKPVANQQTDEAATSKTEAHKENVDMFKEAVMEIQPEPIVIQSEFPVTTIIEPVPPIVKLIKENDAHMACIPFFLCSACKGAYTSKKDWRKSKNSFRAPINVCEKCYKLNKEIQKNLCF